MMLFDKDFVLNDMGDEFIITCKNNKKFSGIIRINKTGAFVWNLLKDGKNIEEIRSLSYEKYDANRDIIDRDLEKFLSTLKEAGAITDNE